MEMGETARSRAHLGGNLSGRRGVHRGLRAELLGNRRAGLLGSGAALGLRNRWGGRLNETARALLRGVIGALSGGRSLISRSGLAGARRLGIGNSDGGDGVAGRSIGGGVGVSRRISFTSRRTQGYQRSR